MLCFKAANLKHKSIHKSISSVSLLTVPHTPKQQNTGQHIFTTVWSVCPWPTFLSLHLAWKVLTQRAGGRLASQNRDIGQERKWKHQGSMKMWWIYITEWCTIKGEHPLELLLLRVTVRVLCHPWEAGFLSALLYALMYFNHSPFSILHPSLWWALKPWSKRKDHISLKHSNNCSWIYCMNLLVIVTHKTCF